MLLPKIALKCRLGFVFTLFSTIEDSHWPFLEIGRFVNKCNANKLLYYRSQKDVVEGKERGFERAVGKIAFSNNNKSIDQNKRIVFEF